MPNQTTKNQIATFGAGCFWGVEEIFRHLKGVKNTVVGYMGGTLPNPIYEDVCTNKTGHVEVIQVEYDPDILSYEELLKVFWESHNPITPNQQGLDIGTQYRSVIFFHTREQEVLAKESKAELEKSEKYKRPIVTEIKPAATFYRAEEYHQRYLEKRRLSSCHP